MKKRLFTFTLLILCCVFFAACQNRPTAETSQNYFKWYGQNKETVMKDLDFGETEPEIQGDQETYSFVCKENDSGITAIHLTFYHDIFMAAQLDFSDMEKAYDYTRELRKNLESEFGEKSTYPGISASDRGSYDELTGLEDVKTQFVYYEDWTPEIPENLQNNISLMLNGKPCSRLDLRFQFTVFSEDLAAVSVNYSAIP